MSARPIPFNSNQYQNLQTDLCDFNFHSTKSRGLEIFRKCPVPALPYFGLTIFWDRTFLNERKPIEYLGTTVLFISLMKSSITSDESSQRAFVEEGFFCRPQKRAHVVKFDEGKKLYEEKKYSGAFKKFDEVVSMDNYYSEAVILRFDCKRELKKEENEKKFLELKQLVLKHPNDPNILFQRGELHLKMEKHEHAINDFKRCLELKENHYMAQRQIGFAYHKLQDYEKSISEFSKAEKMMEKINEPDYLLFYLRGNVYQDMCTEDRSLIEKSRKDYDRSIDINPNFDKSFRNLGHLCLKYNDKKYDKAEENFEKALKRKLHPESYCGIGDVCYEKHGRWGDQKDLQKALDCYMKAVSINPGISTEYASVGLVLKSLGRYEETKKLFEIALCIRRKFYPWDQLVVGYLVELYGILANEYRDSSLEQEYLRKSKKFSKMYKDQPYGFPSHLYFFQSRFRGMGYFGEEKERCMDDFGVLQRKGEREVYDGDLKLYESLRLLKKKQEDDDREKKWIPFQKDEEKDVMNFEKNQTETLSKLLSENVSFKDLVIERVLGSGVYGAAYLCRVKLDTTNDKKLEEIHKKLSGNFVLKVFKTSDGYFRRPDDTAKIRISAPPSLTLQKEMMERDALVISGRKMFPYHRSVVSILLHKLDEIDYSKLPDVWRVNDEDDDEIIKEKDNNNISVPRIRRGCMILMKYYFKDLESYAKERKGKPDGKFSTLEICYILLGVLKGLKHLQENYIVHNDLHAGNVFVDEFYGRVYIGDFGYAMNLNVLKSFEVVNGDKVQMRKVSDFSSKPGFSLGTDERYTRVGNERIRPPEVVNVEDSNIINYKKSDIYAVGQMVKFDLILKLEEEPNDMYNSNDDQFEAADRKKKVYERMWIDLQKTVSKERLELLLFIQKLIEKNFDDRFDVEEAVEKLGGEGGIIFRLEKALEEEEDEGEIEE